jgi:hypothetical protein
VYAIQAVACGDPDFAEALRDHVEAQLDGSGIVKSYEFHDGSSPRAAGVERRDLNRAMQVTCCSWRWRAWTTTRRTTTSFRSPTACDVSGYELDPRPASPEAVSVCSGKQEPYIELRS